MMKLINAKLKDVVYTYGLTILLLSLISFYIPECASVQFEMGWFLGNFLFTLVYFFILLFAKRLYKRKGHGVRGIFLILLLISAFALNREMNVFETSTDWLCILLIISCINILAFPYRGIMPKWLRHIQSFLSGISLCCFFYLSCYLLPLYVFGVFLFFVLGISLHAFVGLLFSIYIILLVKRTRRYRIGFWTGIGTGLAIVLIYCITWGYTVKKINSSTGKSGLPEWVTVAQHTPHNFVTQQVLKSGLVYTVPSTMSSNFFWREPSMNFNERRKHDPLVMTAAFFCGTPYMDQEDRVRVLESMYDSRNQAEERLWSGDELFTDHVNTIAHIWPRLHMAYTEKTVTVSSHETGRSWRREEAIYTFHLPEGAVVSSLSLWINNKEEKGILTTKAKADSAYKQIVGVENRDPSVVHWQEGNTVAIRVFPIEDGQSRQFKIGITSPLTKDGNKLIYRNIYFDGPIANQAREDVKVSFETAPVDLDQALERHGSYKAGWEMSFKDEGISSNIFGTNGNVFTISSYKKELTAATVKNVYLDINKAWTKQELEDVLVIFKDIQKWVYYDGQLSQINDGNAAELFSKLHEQQFSLFPLYVVNDPANAMLISKGLAASPAITDLEGDFTEKTKTFLSQHQKIMLFNLGGELSPYMRSLKECRAFRYDQGDIALLKEHAATHTFPADIENAQRVVVEPADMMITTTGGTCVSTAPDHLQRLFAYNHIMQQSGADLLKNLPESDALVEEAKAAYIVTPFSSLVVLETQKDYDRFNIEDSENSLKNASLQSKGAVPEPHEWALIILAILMLGYLKFKNI
jgi:XrtN system VIT domain protein